MDEEYSIKKLAEEAGVSVRTVRFYIDEGLLPQPQMRGSKTVYDQEYVDRLKLIRRLKDAFLPLREIRQKMNSLNNEEVRQLLNAQIPEANPNANQAIKFLALAEDDTQFADPAGGTVNPGGNAAQYIARVLEAHSDPKSAPPAHPGLRLGQNLSLPPSGRPPTPAPFVTSEHQPNPAPNVISNRSSQPQPPSQSAWMRIVIIPGFEIHVSDEVFRDRREVIQQFVERARRVFEPRHA